MASRLHFLRRFSYLFFANGINLLTGVILVPVLAAVYTPQQFGEWAIAVSLAAIMAIASTLQFEQFVLSARYKFQAAGIVLGIFIINTCIFAGGSVAGVALAHFGLLPFAAANWFFTLALGLCLAMVQAFNFLAIRKGAYTNLANQQLSYSVSRFAGQYGFHATLLAAHGMLWGELLGRLAQLAVTLRLIMRGEHTNHPLKKRRLLRAGAATLRRLLPKALHATFARMLGDGVYLAVPAIIGFLYVAQDVGYFNIAHNAVLSAINAFGMTVANFYLGESARHVHDSKATVRRNLFVVLRYLVPCAVLFAAVSYFAAEPVITLFFAPEWHPVAGVFKVLLPALSVQLAIGPLTNTLNLLQKPHVIFYINLCWCVLFGLVCAATFMLRLPFEAFLAGFAASVVVRYLLNLYFTVHYLKDTP